MSNTYDSEPPETAPEYYSITADCDHEILNGEFIFEMEGETLCPDCMEDKFNNLPMLEKAELLGCGYSIVKAPRRTNPR